MCILKNEITNLLHPMFVGHILHNKLKIQKIENIVRVGRNRIKISVKNLLGTDKLVNIQR